MPDLPEKPLNREPSVQELTSTFLTPTDSAYDRNHGVLAHLDADTHHVRVDGAVDNILELSLANLTSDFPQYDVIQEVQSVDWQDAAIMNCQWRGPRLKDVPSRAGIALPPQERATAHVAFACYTAPCEDEAWYGASIPLTRALRDDADVLLATEMNGSPLTPNHGFPVRVVTPGIAGARAVKWLDRITVQKRESESFYMQHDYKVLPPEVRDSQQAEGYWGITPAVQEMPVNSSIAVPVEGGTVERGRDGCIAVAGYAVPSGDDGPITRVEVSADGGQSWTAAELILHPEAGKWSWQLWKARLPVPEGVEKTTLYSRATDQAGNTQPKVSQWNLRGVCYNGYGEAADVRIK
ncbi:sulfite oxidase-like protein [Hortaea werneckii]|nr:sulfite oxidase-like protein [Hortaea werneckii]